MSRGRGTRQSLRGAVALAVLLLAAMAPSAGGTPRLPTAYPTLKLKLIAKSVSPLWTRTGLRSAICG